MEEESLLRVEQQVLGRGQSIQHTIYVIAELVNPIQRTAFYERYSPCDRLTYTVDCESAKVDFHA